MVSTDSPTGARRRFPDIDPSMLQHPLDRMATEHLKKLRGFDILTAKFIEFGFERARRILNDASNVKVGPKQIPVLYDMLRESCAILDMPEPDLYVSQRPQVNAYTSGHIRPYIIVYSGLLELMEEDEVMAVIAHELGHVKCGHILYMTMAQQIEVLILFASQFIPAVGSLISGGMQYTLKSALTYWQRRAELTADRAALLVMQDSGPCISMLSKLAGGTSKAIYQLDPEEFLEQARRYKDKEDESQRGANRVYQFLVNNIRGDSHPFAVERVHYLNEWIASTEYDLILSGHYTRVAHKVSKGAELEPAPDLSQVQALYCSTCGQPATNITSKFCSRCGNPL